LSTNMCMQQNFNELYFDLLPSHNIVTYEAGPSNDAHAL